MDFKVSSSTLLTALQTTGRAASTRAVTPALSGILLTVSGARARLRATDMELSIQTELEVEGASDGSALLPARLLTDIVRSLPSGQVRLAAREAERDVEISAGASRFHLRTLAADDFPRLADPEGDPVQIPADAFTRTVDLVARAASRDDMRPVLTGVLVTAGADSLTMVATDSYRLSVKRTRLDAALETELEANVPARALRELSRLAAQEGAETIGTALMRNQAVFTAGPVVVTTRLIEGQFPNYKQLLPESYEHDVRLRRDEFLEVARRVSQLAQRNAPLRLALAEGELTVSAETPDVGDARETIPASFSGEPLEIGFNPEFLKDGIESIGSEELLLRLISPLRPGLLQPLGDEDFSYLVMPIRLNV